MEMPVDILTHRFGKLVDNGDFAVSDYQAVAISIDEELQEKFVFVPDAELSEIAEQIEDHKGWLKIGQRPGYLCVDSGISVEDAWTLAENALAIWWLRKRDTELEAEKLAKRPEPGVYRGTYAGHKYFTVIVTADQRVMVPQAAGGIDDYSAQWDEHVGTSLGWTLQRIDITEGTVEA